MVVLIMYRKAIQVYESLLPLLPDPVDPTNCDPSWTYNNIASSYSALRERQKAGGVLRKRIPDYSGARPVSTER
jgi:hypothetical protein